jgi:hypothetical protein
MKQALLSLIRRTFGRQVVAFVAAPRVLAHAELRFVVGGDGGTDAPRVGW